MDKGEVLYIVGRNVNKFRIYKNSMVNLQKIAN